MHLDLGIDFKDAFFGNGQHTTGAAAWVVDGAHDMTAVQRGFILHQQQIDHQANHFARRKVLARVFVEGFV
jgi:hypothetical protein